MSVTWEDGMYSVQVRPAVSAHALTQATASKTEALYFHLVLLKQVMASSFPFLSRLSKTYVCVAKMVPKVALVRAFPFVGVQR